MPAVPPENLSLPSETSAIDNARVAWLFHEMADLLELNEGDLFRIRAYRNAGRAVETHPVSVTELARTDPKRLRQLNGIGSAMAAAIDEVGRTGTFAGLERMRAVLPSGVRALMQLPGVGPNRARVLTAALGIRTLEDLERAVVEERVRGVKGFGPASEVRLREALELKRKLDVRIARAKVMPYAFALRQYLVAVRPGTRVEIGGSFRRRTATVGDLNLVATDVDPDTILTRLIDYPGVHAVLTRSSASAVVRLKTGLRVTLQVVPPAEFGAALYWATGSATHDQRIQSLGAERGIAIGRRGVFRGGVRLGGASEEDLLAALGLPWIPPELREDRGEVEAAARDALPDLVMTSDIRGDLQSHSTDSDGRASLAAMADAARARGLEYIAITDHSPALRMVAGLDAAGFRDQARRIDELNRGLEGFQILKGAEVDIRADGSLDLDDATLESFDLVVASIHSRFDLPESDQTERILRGLSHQAVDILGHPTGRILGKRPPMRLDLDTVLDAALEHGVLLEINAQPDRLDLDDVAAHRAIQKGVRLVVSTDAHASREFGYLPWGIDQARRAWATRVDIANTLPLPQFLQSLRRAH